MSEADVRRIALLARLRLSDAQVAEYRGQLGAILGHMRVLREVDVAGVEPMRHAGGPDAGVGLDALEADEPRAGDEMLGAEALRRIAPAMVDDFVSVPKVIGEGSA